MKAKRLQALDLFKGIAMVLIILVHLNQSFTSYLEPLEFCQMGCQLFFVASGFGACLSLNSHNETKSFWKNTATFYLSRIKTIIIPVYLIIIIFYILTSLSARFWQPIINISSSQKVGDLVLSMLFLNGVSFEGCNSVYPGAWFIGTTMLLYVLAPFLFESLKTGGKGSKFLLSLLFTLISYSIIIFHVYSIPNGKYAWLASNSFGYYSFLNQLPCFLLGMILYFEYKDGIKIRNWFLWVLELACSFFMTLYFFYESPTQFRNILCTLCMGIFGYFLLKLLLQIEFTHTFPKIVKIPELFGENSLYIFLTHTIIVWYFVDFLSYYLGLYGIDFGKRRYLFIMIPICIVLSYALGQSYKKLCQTISSLIFKK